jgi:hypothetical protein
MPTMPLRSSFRFVWVKRCQAEPVAPIRLIDCSGNRIHSALFNSLEVVESVSQQSPNISTQSLRNFRWLSQRFPAMTCPPYSVRATPLYHRDLTSKFVVHVDVESLTRREVVRIKSKPMLAIRERSPDPACRSPCRRKLCSLGNHCYVQAPQETIPGTRGCLQRSYCRHDARQE